MKRNIGISIVCICMCLLSGSTAFAAGFALYEGSVRANALGGSVIAKADDTASAGFFNPAGMTQLPGTQIAMGVSLIMPSTHVTTERYGRSDDSKLKWNYFAPPYGYISYQLNDRFWLGAGFFARFGLGTQFDEDWPGAENGYNSFVRVVEFNPNIAWKVDDKLSLSGGFSLARMDLKLESKAPLVGYDTSLTGNGYGVGYNFGVHYKLLDWVKLGLSYRSKIRINLSGRADFIQPDWASASGFVRDGAIDSHVTLPDELFMGVNFQVLPKLSVELSTVYTRWSSFDQMSIKFDNNPAGAGRKTKEKAWRDVWRWQIGVEYNLTDWCDLRTGFVYDNGPIPRHTVDYLVPSNDRQMWCVGTGFKWRAWTFDFSYNLLLSENRKYNARPADGVLKGRTHEGVTHIFGIGFGYKF